jgi:hypothetical protein
VDGFARSINSCYQPNSIKNKKPGVKPGFTLFYPYAGVTQIRFDGYTLRFFAETPQKREHHMSLKNCAELLLYLSSLRLQKAELNFLYNSLTSAEPQVAGSILVRFIKKFSMATSKTAKKKTSTRKKSAPAKKWSHDVMEHSDAMDLEQGIFKSNSPAKIAKSVKHSSEQSNRRKGTPFQSAMSFLNFYINRGGKNLSASRKRILERSKDELRKLFHRKPETSAKH